MGKLAGLKKALDMSKQARMQRARDMGFDTDTVYYHGTRHDIEAFDPDMIGEQHDFLRDDDPGTFFTTNAESANFHTEPEDLDYRVKSGESPNVIPTYHRDENPLVVKTAQYEENYYDQNRNRLLAEAYRGGHDSIVVHGSDGKLKYIFDPSNIRSVNAAFDPAKKDSANLLAGTSATGIGLGATMVGGQMFVPEDANAGPLSSTIKGGKVIGDMLALPGQPSSAKIPGMGDVSIGGNSMIQESARKLSHDTGVPLYELEKYLWPDKAYSEAVAREFDLMKHDPSDPRVAASYEQLKQETLAQYEQMLRDGVKPYFIKGDDPYKDSPYLALMDIGQNKRLGVFPTDNGFGTDAGFAPTGHPLLEETGLYLDGQPMLYNDVFRAVHDYYGHGKGGFGFRGAGEDNAYRAHSGMYSDAARPAAASETRGQNSWLNYGPYGEANRTAGIEDTKFADQKAGLLPNWATTQRTPKADERRQRFFEGLRGSESTRLGGLQGAITDEGRLRIVHYSGAPLERVDPTHYGRNLSGRTRSERQRASGPEFQERSYYGIESEDNPYKKESGLGQYRTETEIPIEQVYDIRADPDNLAASIPQGLWPEDYANQLEKAVRDAGYSGYFKRDEKLGDVAAIFDPLEANRTYSVVLGGPLAYEIAAGNAPDFQIPELAAEQAVPSDYGQLSAEAELLKLTNRERARRATAFLQRRRARNPQFQALKQAVFAGLEKLDMPQQGLMALGRLGHGLVTGDENALQNAAQVATQPIEQSAQQFGDYVYDETGSPAAATAGYVGANIASPF